MTPLLESCAYGRTKIVEILLQSKDIDVNVADGRGITGLWIASRNGYKEIVQLLVEHPHINVTKGFALDENGISIRNHPITYKEIATLIFDDTVEQFAMNKNKELLV